MSEFISETQRHSEGQLGRDLVLMTPEAIALRALIDTIGSFVVVENESTIDVIETVSFNGE